MHNLKEILLPLLNKGVVLSIFEESSTNQNLLMDICFRNNIKYSFKHIKNHNFYNKFFIVSSLKIQDNSNIKKFSIYSIRRSRIHVLNIIRRFILYFSLSFINLILFKPMPIIVGFRKGEIFVARSILNKRRFEIKILKFHLLKIIMKEVLVYFKNLFYYKILIINS